jgi:hypothetical protein
MSDDSEDDVPLMQLSKASRTHRQRDEDKGAGADAPVYYSAIGRVARLAPAEFGFIDPTTYNVCFGPPSEDEDL